MNAALPFFLLGLPLVLAAYDLGRVRPEGNFGGLQWKNLTSSWSRGWEMDARIAALEATMQPAAVAKRGCNLRFSLRAPSLA
jgi:hypothetical protein